MPTMSRKILLCLTGEPFRYGGQFSRGRGTPESIPRQAIATASHQKLISVLKDKFNAEVEITLFTYSTNPEYDILLKSMYNKSKIIFKETPSSDELAFNNWFHQKFTEEVENKSFTHAIIVRLDMYLKNYFFEKLYLSDKQVIFGFADSNSYINLSVLHGLCIIPVSFFKHIRFWTPHEAGINLIHVFGNSSINFLINTLHVLSSDLQWNPLFVNVGRKYARNIDPIGNYLGRDTIINSETGEISIVKDSWAEYDKMLVEDLFKNLFY